MTWRTWKQFYDVFTFSLRVACHFVNPRSYSNGKCVLLVRTNGAKGSPIDTNGVETCQVEKYKNAHFVLHYVAVFARAIDPYVQVRTWAICLLQVIGQWKQKLWKSCDGFGEHNILCASLFSMSSSIHLMLILLPYDNTKWHGSV